MDIRQFEDRKRDHIRHALDPVNQAIGLSGLESVHLVHEALPELDFKDVSISAPCLGSSLSTPFYIAGMTAGHADAHSINRELAIACARRGWAMGVGSQRRDLHGSSPSDDWESIRESAPGLVLFANLGISQVLHASVGQIRELLDRVGAQALAIHTNPMQECIQPEGTPQFKGARETLRRLCTELSIPVVLKETGCGFSESTLRSLKGIPLAAIDVSGLGGTHWGRIEGARAQELAEPSSPQSIAARTFAGWGESTVHSVLAAKSALPPTTEIWASGGVRTGLDAAKLIALGAHRVGYAKPALEAALKGSEALDAWMNLQEFELKVALFCTGSENPAALREKEGVWKASVV